MSDNIIKFKPNTEIDISNSKLSGDPTEHRLHSTATIIQQYANNISDGSGFAIVQDEFGNRVFQWTQGVPSDPEIELKRRELNGE